MIPEAAGETHPDPAAAGVSRSARAQAVLAQRLARRAAGGGEPSIPRLADRDRAPLSFAQERLWFLEQLDPGSAVYNLAVAWSLRGPLDVAALAAALDEVARRHESLRTVFEPHGPGAVQRVLPHAPAPLPVVDLQALPEEAGRQAVRALAAAEASRPFDLARGPLFRRALLRLAAGDRPEHVLLLTLHHVVSDGWSQAILAAEVTALYAAGAAGLPSPLSALPIQYADYAAWQREQLAAAGLERHLAYWREALAGAPALLELPADRPRPPLQTFRGGRRTLRLPETLTARLGAVARSERASLFMALLAAFQALLARHGGGDDVPVGTPVAGRSRLETERLIGLFVNTLVLRGDLSGDPTFRALLGRVREAALGAFAHQDLPFERLVEELRPERALTHAPLFQVMFVLQNAPRDLAPLGELRIGALEVEPGTSKFDLTLTLYETADGLLARLEYNRDLFDATTIDRLLARYRALLVGAAADPERRLSDLPCLTLAERHQLTGEWNDTARAYGPDVCLHELIAAQAARTPAAVAVVCEDESLTYAALAARAKDLARRLARLGVGRETLVAVAVERSLEMMVALLAVLEAGAAYVPIDPSYPAERLAFMLDDSQAGARRPVVLTHERLAAALPLDGLRARGGQVLLLDAPGAEEPGEPVAPPAARAFPDGPAYMIYTSGSTGRPKGAVNTHRAIVNRLLWMQEAFGLGPGDRVLQKTPLSFDVSVWELFWPLLAGARLVVARPGGHQDPRYLAELIAAEGVTTLHFVPSMLQVFLDEPEAARCRSLRRVICSGEALPPALVRRFYERLPGGPELHNLYGPTEAAVDVTWWPCPPDGAAGVPIGRPIANLALHVADRWLQPAGIGVAGELLIGGVGLARGYHARPDLTADRFVPDPFGAPGSRLYRTGDLARTRADGAIEYLGRLDHQIKLRGFRIELGEIEAALAAHPQVREAVVLARDVGDNQDKKSFQVEKRLVAYVVPQQESMDAGLPPVPDSFGASSAGDGTPVGRATSPQPLSSPEVFSFSGVGAELASAREGAAAATGAETSSAPTPNEEAAAAPAAKELREWLSARLPEYMVPSAFVVLEALPLSPNGKLDRKALPAPGRPAATAAVPPRTAAEAAVAEVWRRVLGLDAVGAEDNFFDLGGHSLLLVQVQRELRERFRRDLSVVDLFKYPTIAAVAAYLAEEEAAPAAVPAPAPAAAAEPLAGEAVAIVGMAGRFPGAASVEELWRRLCAGEELLRSFGDEELLAAGVDPELLADPRYVRARGVVDGADLFDARFFDYAPREAQLIDPQQRVFLECAWEALEDAGHAGDRPSPRAPRVGVYAGVGENGYVARLYADRELVRAVGAYQVSIANRPDYLPTRVSYKLNLRGPSVAVQTACSTSLVAVHLACRALLAGECDLALAGGVSISAAQTRGYLYEEGHILSPDGHCRAFDAGADGTVLASGAAVVVLRRLADALADGDRIDAVIRGSAINNDGAGKVGFTAPGVDGQAEVIAAALGQAGLDPAAIGYVEAHGTGTRLGDPIEVRALTEVFGAAAGRPGACGLGSVKTNLGHLDAAAGVTGLLKAALAVKHGRIPPSLHFTAPNPELRLAEGPFRVVTTLEEWREEGRPRRAGVSSFGIGGTNAHAVVEEPPATAAEPAPSRPWQLLLLSAKTAAALDAASARLAEHLERRPEQDLADVAHTLRVGRRAFAYRRALVCRERGEAAAALRTLDPERVLSSSAVPGARAGGRPVAFLFPGQGAQHPGMGAEPYREEPAYREALDRCCALLAPELGLDLRELLHAEGGAAAPAAERLVRTELAQPALFAVEWALAALWAAWGVRPWACLGHSIGEYTAACLAGVFTLEEAARLVAARGRLMGSLPPGAMLGVALSEAAAAERIASFGDSLAVAAVNGPGSCVVSGPADDVERLRARLEADGVTCRRLHTSHAFHSPMVGPVLPAFAAELRQVALRPPAIPFLSNVTGTWITAAEATDPGYWVRHLRATVRFADGLAALFAAGDGVLLEVGPGRTLSTLAAQHPERGRAPAVASFRQPRDPRPEEACLLEALGRLWLFGAAVDWQGFQGGERRRRVALPTYPFERRRHWVDLPPRGAVASRQWRSAPPQPEPEPPVAGEVGGEEARQGLAVPYVAPRDDVERRLAELFGEVLGVGRVGVHDGFFDLGGSSLLAVRLTSRLREALGAEPSPHLLIEAPTVAALARRLRESRQASASAAMAPGAAGGDPCLATLHPGGGGRPLVLVHPAGGHLYWFRDLAALLGPERPVLGLRARGLLPGEEPLATVEAMAERYLAAVRGVAGGGPCLLGGASMGGMVAWELAQRLRAAGEEVALLALFDTYGPGQMPDPGGAMEERAAAEEPAPGAGLLAREEERRLAAVLRAGTAAMHAYRPRPWPGRLYFFRAAERRPGEPPRPEEPWVDLAGEGAEVHVVPGGHASMHRRPQVEELARRLRSALRLADPGPRPPS